jgi:hypothetical protein
MTEDRVDILSHKYYDSSDFSWLVWMANNTIDPYYDMPINDIDFENYIIDKYGSVEKSMDKILFYRSNWATDNIEISTTQFDLLHSALKKYYSPNLNNNLQIHSYSRKKKNWNVNTNAIISIQLDNISSFEDDDILYSSTGSATIISSSENTILCKNIDGQFLPGQLVAGKYLNTQNTITIPPTNEQSIFVLSKNISDIEAVYWEPVSAYVFEHESNENKRNIELIDNRYKQNMQAELTRVFK